MNIIKRLFYIILILFVLLVAFLSFMLNSTTGLYGTLYLAKKIVPGTLHYQNVQGSLLGPIRIKHLQYEDDDQRIQIDQLSLKWQARALWNHEVRIHQLSAQNVTLSTKPKQDQSTKQAFSWPELPVNVTLSQLKINIIFINDSRFHDLDMAATLTNKHWQLNHFSIHSEDIRFALKGNIDPNLPHQANAYLTVNTPDDAPLRLKGYLSFSGTIKRYQWKGALQHPYPLTLQGSLENMREIQSTVDWPSFEYQATPQHRIHWTKGQLKLYGNYPNIAISASAKQRSPIPSTLTLQGKTDLKTLQFQSNLKSEEGFIHLIGEAGLDHNPFIKITTNAENINLQPLNIPLFIHKFQGNYSHSDQDSTQANLNLTAQQGNLPISVEAQYQRQQLTAIVQQNANTIRIHGTPPFPLTLTLDIPEPSSINPALLGLTTRIQGDIHLLNATQGNARIEIAKGQWQNQQDLSIEPLVFQGGNIHAKLNNQGLDVQGNLTIDPDKALQLSLNMPNYSLANPARPNQPVSGQLKLNINSLDFLKEINTAIENASGSVQTTLWLKGTLDKPELTGNIQLKEGEISLSTMGITLKPIALDLATNNGQWQLSGTIGSQKSLLRLQGNGRFYPEPSGNITLEGKEFLLVNTNEYTIYISPDLKMQIGKEATKISGSILVPKATIKPQTFSSSVNLTDDVIFAKDKQEATSSSPITTDITISMGDNVALNVQGLTAKVVGSTRIQNESAGPINASGQLSIVDGKYSAYGQDLTIDQGELLFSGGQIINPAINVRAVRTFSSSNPSFSSSNRLFDFGPSNIQPLSFSSQTTVGIQVSGRLDTPKITLFSEPGNLSQADILSMLLLGRPASQASSSGGQILLSAISSMNLGGGTKGVQLLSQLQSALGLDFDIQEQAKYDQQSNTVSESRSLAVSKSFSKRLSLSYNVGLSNLDSNGLTLKYLLNRFFNVQVTASTDGSGIDFVYNYQQE